MRMATRPVVVVGTAEAAAAGTGEVAEAAGAGCAAARPVGPDAAVGNCLPCLHNPRRVFPRLHCRPLQSGTVHGQPPRKNRAATAAREDSFGPHRQPLCMSPLRARPRPRAD